MPDHQTLNPQARALPFKPGDVVGVSDWVCVTQEMIEQFGVATLDPDPMHIDPDWARRNSPFGGTIAFGFLTIGLLTRLMHAARGSAVHNDPGQTGVFLNYGFDRLRLVSPVPSGAFVRGRFVCGEIHQDDKGRLHTTFHCAVEIQGETRPALVADWLTVWQPPEAGR